MSCRSNFGFGLIVHTALFCVLSAPSSAPATPQDRIGEKLVDVTLRDTKGREKTLLEYHKGKVLVVAYTGLGCPISSRYAPRLMELYEKHKKKGVRFVAINANPQDSRKAIRAEAKELGIKFPILQDKNQDLTRQLDAKTTTVVFVVDKDNVIRYRGMIDDQYALGEKRTKPKIRYLDKAIRSVLRGKDPLVTRTAAPGCLITRVMSYPPTKPTKPSKVTYASHIAKIVQDNCVKCHRQGQIGPFPLTSYEKVRGWSAMINFVVRDGRMPPWNADEEFDGHFLNQRSLSKKDKERLLAWIGDGMPRGDLAKAPKPRKWPKRWRIGKPDKVFNMPESFLVPKDGVVPYKYFRAKTNFREDKWITAMEAIARAPDVVHHILVFIDDPNQRTNFNRLGLEDGFLCATVPGDTPSIFPPGAAKRLPAGADLVFQIHYTTIGKARRDRSSVGLKFAKGPIDREVRTRGIYNMQLEIPPNADSHEVRSEFATRQDIEILSFMPHMHTRGKDWTYLAHYPDGTEKKLLSVSRYDFNWQESYILKKPLLLPAGTRIECIAHFDNSAGNFENPDPSKSVRWGEQTWEEMMIGYIDWVPARDKSGGALGARVASPGG